MIWEVLRPREDRLHPPVGGALQQPERLLQKDRQAEGRDQRRLGWHFAQRPEDQPLGRQSIYGPDACDQRHHGEQRERQRPASKHRQRGYRTEGGVRTDDRDPAEREIDPVQDAVDQGVADREQTVEAAERQCVGPELHEVQEITRPRAPSFGSILDRFLRLVPVKPVAAQHEHRDLGQRTLARRDHPGQAEPVARKAAAAEAARNPAAIRWFLRPDQSVVDPHRVGGRRVGRAPHDLDFCAFGLDRRDQALADLELLDVRFRAPGE
jgi:hypothetical protein